MADIGEWWNRAAVMADIGEWWNRATVMADIGKKAQCRRAGTGNGVVTGTGGVPCTNPWSRLGAQVALGPPGVMVPSPKPTNRPLVVFSVDLHSGVSATECESAGMQAT